MSCLRTPILTFENGFLKYYITWIYLLRLDQHEFFRENEDFSKGILTLHGGYNWLQSCISSCRTFIAVQEALRIQFQLKIMQKVWRTCSSSLNLNINNVLNTKNIHCVNHTWMLTWHSADFTTFHNGHDCSVKHDSYIMV